MSQELLDKALRLIDQHLTQIQIDSTTMTDKGTAKGLNPYDSQVIDRYAKILITLNKKPGEDGLDDLTDAELEAIANGKDNVPNEMGDSE